MIPLALKWVPAMTASVYDIGRLLTMQFVSQSVPGFPRREV